MRTPKLFHSIAPRLILSLTLAFSLLLATASGLLADGHEGTLPASGGTVAFESGVTIKTSDGASSSDVDVTYTALEGDAVPGPAPEGLAVGSLIFSLDTGGAKFKQYAEVTIPYNADDLAAAKGGRDDNIQIYTWDSISESWIHTTSIPDVLNRTLTIYQNELGTYAIVITPPDPTPTPVPTEAPEPPAGGDYGVTTGMMMALALMGVMLLAGGGYVLARGRNR